MGILDLMKRRPPRRPFIWIKRIWLWFKGAPRYEAPDHFPEIEKQLARAMSDQDSERVMYWMRERARRADPGWIEHLEDLERFKAQRGRG